MGKADLLPPLEELTVELIDIPSTTGEEAAYAGRVQELLETLGLEVRTQEVAPGRPNLIATPPGNPDPAILLCTHLDTVPPHIPSSIEPDRRASPRSRGMGPGYQ